MELKVTAKGRGSNYEATGIFDGKGLTVLKGSKISDTVGAKTNPIAIKLRTQKDTVNNFILQKNVSFRSPSTAASFVTGNIANGMRVWKLEDGRPLGSLLDK